MTINDAAMTVAANALRGALLYGQLHSAAAGASGTDNLCTSGRLAITWTAATGPGDFGLAAPIGFDGGTPDGDVFSLTLWSASTAGTFYGEIQLTGDSQFDSSGAYSVTKMDFAGAAA